MLAARGACGPVKIPAVAGERTACFGGGDGGAVVSFYFKGRWWRRGGRRLADGGEALRSVVARARLSNFFFSSSRIGLDSQTFQTCDALWVGPVPGDIAEIEAYCRIFRSAEQFHTAIMDTLCNTETGECSVSYDIASEDMLVLEEKVVAVLGCMLALLNRGREDLLSGRSSSMNSFRIADVNILESKLPPLAIFRGEMKRCCESLQVALENFLSPCDDRSTDIWKLLQRLKNVCYDAGFPRRDGYPCPTIFANWSPVYFSTEIEDRVVEDSEVAFWRGGQVTAEGLTWLLERGYKTIVDLREEAVKDEYYQSAIQRAISCGKVEVVNLPVELGTAPSMKQVQRFASLVSDPNNRPVYLHSQEGVGRTSAMVSRWREYVSRSSMQSLPKHSRNLNGKPLKNATDEGQKEQISIISKIDRDSEVKMNADTYLAAACNYKGTNGNLSAQIEQQNGMMSSEPATNHNLTPRHGADAGVEANFILESDPLRAQFPLCNIFSRKEMRQFFNDRGISPKSYYYSQKKRSNLLPILSETHESPVQTNEKFASSQSAGCLQARSSNGEPTIGDSLLKTNVPSVSNGKPVINGSAVYVRKSTDVFADGESCSVMIEPQISSNLGDYANKQMSSTTIEEEKTKNIESPRVSESNGLDLVERNMCASATGVVRVQSRKKAEMYLVRTDGFSCTREKVTESSLAFTHPSTQQQMLMWKSPPKTVLLLKKLGEELMEEAKEVASFLFYQEKMNVLVEPDVHDLFARIPGYGFVQTFYSQDTSGLHERVDFVACLGGDGVILHASNLFRGAVPPVVSFNLGSLGFLTSHTFDEYRHDLKAVIHGNNTLDGVYITLRMRLHCEIFRNGKAVPGKVFDVLNEVVVDRGSNPYLSKIECYEHDRLITKVQGDGVIIATPTGSTAYSTAAGGSMVHPNVPCMLFTPICPHSLSFRPVILPDSARLELKIPEDTRSNAWVSFDGKRRQQLSKGDSVRICMSQHPLPTVNKCDQTGDWFRSLIRCLNWNERREQKAF